MKLFYASFLPLGPFHSKENKHNSMADFQPPLNAECGSEKETQEEAHGAAKPSSPLAPDYEAHSSLKEGVSTGPSNDQLFFKACEEGDLNAVRTMVERRTQEELLAGRGSKLNDTPLHCAALAGHLPVAQYLCEQGADKEARDYADETPLHSAAEGGHLHVMQYLCEQGADKEVQGDGGTPLHLATTYGHLSMVQYLCQQGADKEAKGDSGRTALHWAASEGHLPVAQYLCEQGADKEARDEDNWTPLHRAAGNDQLSVVQYLCEQGADRQAADEDGETPLSLARENEHTSVAQYLEECV